MKKEVIIIIPAYNPNEELIKLVKNLKKLNNNIIVVNDGSETKEIFNKITDDCTVITHKKNKGKGRALKTAFEYVIKNNKDCIGVVTADADGQHDIQDINNIKKELEKHRNVFIIGVRNFKQKGIPIRNKIGNYISNFLFYIKTKQKLEDTQSGLRAIPIKFLQNLLDVNGEKYEYEINMLIFIINKIKIKQVFIKAIYSKKIKSNFKPIKNSIQIVKETLKYKIDR